MVLAGKMKNIWQQRNFQLILVFIFSSIILLIYIIHVKIRQFFRREIFIFFPVSSYNLYLFILKQILVLIPFLASLNIIGIYLIVRRNRFRVVVVPISEEVIDAQFDMDILRQEDRLILETLFMTSGRILQVDLRKRTNLKGYQITRILNRFESLGWIARKRYGMTNIIYLKLRPEKEF